MCHHPGCYSNCHVWSGFSIVFRIKLFFRHFQGFGVAYRPCLVCKHPYEDHCTRYLLWEKRDYTPEIVDEGGNEETKKDDDKQRTRIIDFDKTIANLDKDMEDALISLGRITQSYSTSSLMGSLPGQIKKSIRLLEMYLKAAQQSGKTDARSIEAIEQSLEDMKGKLKIVEEAGKRAGTNVGRVTKFRKYTRSLSVLLTGPDKKDNGLSSLA